MKQTRGFLEGLITKKITSLGEEWIFSAMTHLNKNCTGQSFCFKLRSNNLHLSDKSYLKTLLHLKLGVNLLVTRTVAVMHTIFDQ